MANEIVIFYDDTNFWKGYKKIIEQIKEEYKRTGRINIGELIDFINEVRDVLLPENFIKLGLKAIKDLRDMGIRKDFPKSMEALFEYVKQKKVSNWLIYKNMLRYGMVTDFLRTIRRYNPEILALLVGVSAGGIYSLVQYKRIGKGE